MRKLKALLLVVSIVATLFVTSTVEAPSVGAQSITDQDYRHVYGQSYSWRVEQDGFSNGDIEIRAYRCDYWQWQYCDPTPQLHARVKAFACFQVVGGGGGLGPARVQVRDNWNNYGASCNFPTFWGGGGTQFCYADRASTWGAQFAGWDQNGNPCPYPHASGWLAYGYYAPLDTNWDPRLSPHNYHYWLLL